MTVIGHPADIAVEDASPITGGPVVAVATTNLTFPYRPSNIRLYDVSDEQHSDPVTPTRVTLPRAKQFVLRRALDAGRWPASSRARCCA